MEPIQNQPPPYSLWDIDLYALQRERRMRIETPIDLTLPKPFELASKIKTKKSEKGKNDPKAKDAKDKENNKKNNKK